MILRTQEREEKQGTLRLVPLVLFAFHALVWGQISTLLGCGLL